MVSTTGVTSSFVHEGANDEALPAGRKPFTESYVTKTTGVTAALFHAGTRPAAKAVDRKIPPKTAPAINEATFLVVIEVFFRYPLCVSDI